MAVLYRRRMREEDKLKTDPPNVKKECCHRSENKSTTMKMISGFLEPDEGSAAICGHDIQTDPINAKRHIGYLPEGAPAYSDMIVGDFLEFVGKLRGMGGTYLNNRLK